MMIPVLLTVTVTAALCPVASVTVTVAVPAAIGVTVKVALGPVPAAGATVATVVLLLDALRVPE